MPLGLGSDPWAGNPAIKMNFTKWNQIIFVNIFLKDPLYLASGYIKSRLINVNNSNNNYGNIDIGNLSEVGYAVEHPT